ncbi:DUF6538 domain-containing protein [Vibrio algicola]|uniref:DUF6538 domain-containing protein n=1 Tax=Vibrio algicola TaxID=2662262 RepID=UPI00389B0D27
MRYLTRKPSGIWYFRYQIPKAFQAQFYNRTEFKRSLHTRDYQRAALLALKLELELRQKIAEPENQFDSTQINGEPVLVSVTTKSRLHILVKPNRTPDFVIFHSRLALNHQA